MEPCAGCNEGILERSPPSGTDEGNPGRGASPFGIDEDVLGRDALPFGAGRTRKEVERAGGAAGGAAGTVVEQVAEHSQEPGFQKRRCYCTEYGECDRPYCL